MELFNRENLLPASGNRFIRDLPGDGTSPHKAAIKLLRMRDKSQLPSPAHQINGVSSIQRLYGQSFRG